MGRLPNFWLGWWCYQTGYRKKSRLKGELMEMLLKTNVREGEEWARMALWATPNTRCGGLIVRARRGARSGW